MQRANQNSFDFVHDTQHIYRELLDCMARPGRIGDISTAVFKLESRGELSAAMIAMAYTLLDREVSFHLAEQQEQAKQYIEWSTFSRAAKLKEAQYVLLDELPLEEELIHLMRQLNCGTLLNPQLSATVIVRVKHLALNSDEGLQLCLTGPGIKQQAICYIDDVPRSFFQERAVLNQEYPLGIDIIFVTDQGDVMALPRTTLVESE